MRRDLDRLEDILEALDAIARHTPSSKEAFDQDELIRVWCLRHLEIIGEASARVSPDVQIRYPNVPWREMIGMRNILIHGYFDVDWDQVWVAASESAPTLRSDIEAILSDVRPASQDT